jgi:hypothetical protein
MTSGQEIPVSLTNARFNEGQKIGVLDTPIPPQVYL